MYTLKIGTNRQGILKNETTKHQLTESSIQKLIFSPEPFTKVTQGQGYITKIA
jgi:hypothetical protein